MKSLSTLGIQYGGHATAAALMKNGEIVAACEQERYRLDKHSRTFSHDALNDYKRKGDHMNLLNKTVTLGLAFLVAAALPLSAAAKSTVTFDPAKSGIKWVGKKVTGQHDGTIKLKSGQVTLEKDRVLGGEFVVDMPSLTVLDLTDAESNGKLTGHLKSDDFFGVEKHPAATLVIKEASPIKDAASKATHQIKGDLTIKGKTNPVSFPAVVSMTKSSVKADATVTVDRTLYDVRYGSGKFFENLGNKVIHDDFTLEVHLEGGR